MPLLSLNKTSFVNFCIHCGQRNTFYFDVGSAKGGMGPYNIQPDTYVKFLLNADNGAQGTYETVTFENGDFPDFTNVSVDQLVSKFNASLVDAYATKDFDSILILSKTPGPTSSVEAIEGDAKDAIGFNLFDDGLHTCCERPCLGFVNVRPNSIEKPSHQVIMLRRCACHTQEMLVYRNEPVPRYPDGSMDYGLAQRKLVNTICKYLHSIGHIDVDSIDYYNSADRFDKTEIYEEFFNGTDEIIIADYEELKQYITFSPQE